MLSAWKDFLAAQGAVLDETGVAHFGDLEGELQAAKNATVLVDLSHLALIAVAGEDCESFLHSQFTNDVAKLASGSVQLNGYCSPKGRLLATFRLWRHEGRYLMQLPAPLRESIQKRLSMFVLRSKVKLADASDELVRMGIAGPAAAALVESVCGVLAPVANTLAHGTDAAVLGLGRDRFEILALLENATLIWKRLSVGTVKVGAGRWDWLTIRAGVPVITPPTQEQFVPQMVNFEVIDGVNFQKGCYPGQEIVARTQYLGRLKRRMYLANIALVDSSTNRAAAGDELFSADFEGQASGMIVNAARSPDGGIDALAVIQIDSARSQTVHFKSPDGPPLALLALPYALP